MTKIPGAVWPLAVLILSLAWPAGSQYPPNLGLPKVFQPEAGAEFWLNIQHYALCGTLGLVWLAAPRGRAANVLVTLAGLAALVLAATQARAELTLTLLWSLAALAATALAAAAPADRPARRTVFGLTDPDDLDRLYGPPPLRVFKNMILLLILCGLAGSLYHVFGLIAPPGPAGLRVPLLDGWETGAHLDFILTYPWLYVPGPWLLVLALLWLAGPRSELTRVPALGTVMLLSLGLWVKYQLGPGWSDGRWPAAWAAVSGDLALVLAWAALAAALISLVRQRFGNAAGGAILKKPWVGMGVTVSVGVAATAVFLGVCFYLGRPEAGTAARPEAGTVRQLGQLEIKLPPDFAIISGRVRLPWAGGWLSLTERRLADDEEPRPAASEDFSDALGLPAWLWETDDLDADGNQRVRLTMDLIFPDRGLASLSLEYAADPRASVGRLPSARRLEQKDSFIEAAAAFLRVYRWLGPAGAAEAPFRSGYRTACGHLSGWDGRPLFDYELAPPPGRGRILVALNLGGQAARSRPPAAGGSGPFQAIVARGLGLRYERRPAEFAGRPGLATVVAAARPGDPLYFEEKAAEYRWTDSRREDLLKLSAWPPADRSELAGLWDDLLGVPR